MARPREFDEDEVLDRALEVFWAKGYEATSVQDLMDAMGLAKGSVYKGFGDKKSLFLRTLDRYLARGLAAYRALDDGQLDAASVLRKWLLERLPQRGSDGTLRGCFAVNSGVELAPHVPEVQARLAHQHDALRELYAATIRRGIAEGTLRPDLDPGQAASFVGVVVDGLAVGCKTGLSAREAHAHVAMTLTALGALPSDA